MLFKKKHYFIIVFTKNIWPAEVDFTLVPPSGRIKKRQLSQFSTNKQKSCISLTFSDVQL